MPVVPKPKNYCRCGCGTEIKATRKYVSGHNLKRRPKDAIIKDGRSYIPVICKECGKTFHRRLDAIKNNNYCSYKCANAVNGRNQKGKILHKARKGEYRTCKYCRKEFYLNPYRAKQKNSGKFCGMECRKKWVIETGYIPDNFISSVNNSGIKNGRYKHGKRIGSNVNKKKVREQVIDRDGGNWCLLCGKPGPGLHLHRIVYGSQGGKYEVDNCVQLCAECHGTVHSNKRKWMPKLRELIKN